MKNSYKFFANKDCKFYPCHKTCDEEINCMFCYCPLYSLGNKCGGNFKILDNGIKDCSDCTIVHNKDGYEYVMKILMEK